MARAEKHLIACCKNDVAALAIRSVEHALSSLLQSLRCWSLNLNPRSAFVRLRQVRKPVQRRIRVCAKHQVRWRGAKRCTKPVVERTLQSRQQLLPIRMGGVDEVP
jgi:hypothetical protein